MNVQVTIIEPEPLEYLPAATLLRIVQATQQTTKNLKAFRDTVSGLPTLFCQFEELDIEIRFDATNEYGFLGFTGDGEKLKTVWGMLRRAGYHTSQRPAKGDSKFNAFWYRAGSCDLFMMFSSSVCKRVKVGTKTVEQDVYETQCGELPEIEPADQPAAVVDSADDMPF